MICCAQRHEFTLDANSQVIAEVIECSDLESPERRFGAARHGPGESSERGNGAGIALLANGRKYTIEAVRVAPFWQAGTERAPNLMRGLSWSPRKKAENTWPAKRGPCLTSVSA